MFRTAAAARIARRVDAELLRLRETQVAGALVHPRVAAVVAVAELGTRSQRRCWHSSRVVQVPTCRFIDAGGRGWIC